MRSRNGDRVRVRCRAAVATIEFGAIGTRNAWTPEIDAEFSAAVGAVDGDPSVRVVVLRGAGEHFCVGRALGGLGRMRTQETGEHLSIGIDEIWRCRKPVIAAIRGSCAGIGLGLALQCDVRFASDTARFSTAFVRRGLPAGHAIGYLLSGAVGPAAAGELLLSGRKFDAAEASARGLVTATVADSALDSHVASYADDLARNCSPRSMAVIKQQLRTDWSRGHDEALQNSLREARSAFEHPDFHEGVASYRDRRVPSFAPLEAEIAGHAPGTNDEAGNDRERVRR